MKSAIEALPGIGAGNVNVTLDGTGYDIALRGTLYLTDRRPLHGDELDARRRRRDDDRDRRQLREARLGMVGRAAAAGGLRGRSLRRRPGAGREGEGLLAGDTSVVVFESDGSTAVDQARLRASHPGAPVVATRATTRRCTLGDNGAGLDLLQPEPGRHAAPSRRSRSLRQLGQLPDRLRQRRSTTASSAASTAPTSSPRRPGPPATTRTCRRSRSATTTMPGVTRQRVRRLDERDRVLRTTTSASPRRPPTSPASRRRTATRWR